MKTSTTVGILLTMSTITCMLAVSACSKKEYPPAPIPTVTATQIVGQNSVALPNTYDSSIRIVELNAKTTCFVLTHSGAKPSAISCVR